MSKEKHYQEQRAAIKAAESLNVVNDILHKAIEKPQTTEKEIKDVDNVFLFAIVQINAELQRFGNLYKAYQDKRKGLK